MLKILKRMQLAEWALVLISVAFIAAQVWLDLKLPDYMAEITQLVKTEGSTVADITHVGGYMIACALGSLALSVIVGFFSAWIASSLSARLRSEMFSKVLDFSMEEINRFSTASLITRSTNDITQIQMVISMGLQSVIKAPIMAVMAIGKIIGKSWQWTAMTGGAIVLLLIVIVVLVTFALPRFRIIQKLTDNLNSVTRENLNGLRVVRAYNAEKYQEAKFERANNELTDTNLFVNRLMALMMPVMTIVNSGLSLAIYWAGAGIINAAGMMDKITLFSDMVVFSSYAMQVIMAFMMVSMVFIMLPRATVSANRINEVLTTFSRIIDGKRTGSLKGVTGEVEFKNVSFKYPGAEDYVVHNVSFKAEPGQTVAFIGSTGSGKSTIINLVPRFYDATEGSVLVDGVDVRDYSQESLMTKLGYVPQRAVLFSGTVRSNVAYGDNGGDAPADEAVARAVRIAQGADFVEALDKKYDSEVAQGGTNFSGGQKQRLSIARAIYRQPEVYIFDDSFSALDYKTDRVLRTALKKETGGATTLIVAQRIGTILDADKIIVLDHGEVVGTGTHSELMQSCEVYREIAYSQLSKEELA